MFLHEQHRRGERTNGLQHKLQPRTLLRLRRALLLSLRQRRLLAHVAVDAAHTGTRHGARLPRCQPRDDPTAHSHDNSAAPDDGRTHVHAGRARALLNVVMAPLLTQPG